MSQIKTFADSEKFWSETKNFLSLQNDKPFRLAMSGGSVANFLEQMPQNFKNFELWQVDERFVSNNHEDSNAKLLNQKILHLTSLPLGGIEGGGIKKNFFPILETPKKSVEAYEKSLKSIHTNHFLFDLTVLGVGHDGHTASLFPFSPFLDSKNLVEHTQTTEFAGKDRLTLTFNAIEKSKKILVLMLGKEKKEIFERITDPKTDFYAFPARKLLDFKQTEILFLEN